mmetsp:Transcript_13761/g.32705  ORF Transcript_13761/g.32705 Transcript_13761/m.32705 type:complete len:356 (-) Transcript_13761:272-1339(-)
MPSLCDPLSALIPPSLFLRMSTSPRTGTSGCCWCHPWSRRLRDALLHLLLALLYEMLRQLLLCQSRVRCDLCVRHSSAKQTLCSCDLALDLALGIALGLALGLALGESCLGEMDDTFSPHHLILIANEHIDWQVLSFHNFICCSHSCSPCLCSFVNSLVMRRPQKLEPVQELWINSIGRVASEIDVNEFDSASLHAIICLHAESPLDFVIPPWLMAIPWKVVCQEAGVPRWLGEYADSNHAFDLVTDCMVLGETFPRHPNSKLFVKQAAHMVQNADVPAILWHHLHLNVVNAKVRRADNIHDTAPLVRWKHCLQIFLQVAKLVQNFFASWQWSVGGTVPDLNVVVWHIFEEIFEL